MRKYSQVTGTLDPDLAKEEKDEMKGMVEDAYDRGELDIFREAVAREIRSKMRSEDGATPSQIQQAIDGVNKVITTFVLEITAEREQG